MSDETAYDFEWNPAKALRIRIVSARKATARERRFYEEEPQ